MSNKDNDKDSKMQTFSHDVLATAQAASKELDLMIANLASLKKVANNIRWRIGAVIAENTAGRLSGIATPVTDPKSGAKGLRMTGTNEIFYTVYAAARYAGTNAGKLDELLDDGAIYCLNIEGERMIPQGALNLYMTKNSESK